MWQLLAMFMFSGHSNLVWRDWTKLGHNCPRQGIQNWSIPGVSIPEMERRFCFWFIFIKLFTFVQVPLHLVWKTFTLLSICWQKTLILTRKIWYYKYLHNSFISLKIDKFLYFIRHGLLCRFYARSFCHPRIGTLN